LNSALAMPLVLVLVVLAACRPPGYGSEPKPDAAPAADASSAVVDAVIDGSVGLCDHAFRVEGLATASSVWVSGSFVGWAGNPPSGAVELALGGDDAWTGSHQFMAGTHQYKLIVDGTDWIVDPSNPNTVDDGQGHTNNVYTCVP
jgi:hypothetical protein